ncbi:hypothetical protein ZIOFF_033901 [Zingiber officinale]|uniref:Trichome birefringence-like N-terminal domain-containing protein n=3 Tax=Zingiber officinale TaxID=94328 RepID=A0A8J5GKD3_ZINOF|nr:hypothetical protein ZIOFF_033901 [Zingiber officinale]
MLQYSFVMEYYFSSLPPPFLLSRRWLLLSLAALLSYLLLCFTLHRIFPAPNAIAIASLSFPRPQGELDSTPLPPAPQVSHLAPTANFPGNGSGKESAEEKCNLFEGRWVHDPRWYPLYRSQRCPFLSDQVSCQRSGRPDSDYERWRWQPNGCDLPRFNGSETLERWRGKRVVVVGDSLNRNMWESMICMLYSAARRKRVYVKNRSAEPKLFRALDHDCTVEFFWSPFLVELKEREGDRAKILHLDNLPASARFWRGADVMVFNTGHWWTHHGKMRAWDYFQIREELTEEMEPAEAFNRALRTWARWVDSNVDPRQTSVFFRSISPEHKRENLQWCYNQTRPISDDERYVWQFPKSMVTLVERTLLRMRTPVRYLNVTQLSGFRRDAHTGVYTSRQGKLLTPEQRKEPERFADCSHWCLPGLPDTWNELLFASLLETSLTTS